MSDTMNGRRILFCTYGQERKQQGDKNFISGKNKPGQGQITDTERRVRGVKYASEINNT